VFTANNDTLPNTVSFIFGKPVRGFVFARFAIYALPRTKVRRRKLRHDNRKRRRFRTGIIAVFRFAVRVKRKKQNGREIA